MLTLASHCITAQVKDAGLSWILFYFRCYKYHTSYSAQLITFDFITLIYHNHDHLIYFTTIRCPNI
uniref:Uncharacterized protein n=1 Tax=Anguilla anguilla TaxID=7936 RepID=A0A0E9X108_ANGAN